MHESSPPDGRRPNHLAGQTSPYLLQHLYNPVDWHAWGTTALEKARRENRPIFLSIGYAACHWCHVMERESFESSEVAGLLNRHFVPIKVDREERPDIDEIYMNAVQLLTGQGGWPLSVFLTPGLEPFFGGTYFPPEDRHGRIGFASLLRRLQEAWSTQRQEVDRSAARLTAELRRIAAGAAGTPHGEEVTVAQWSRAVAELTGRFDARWGGFGGAPKFPPDGALALLLTEHARTGEEVPLSMATTTLDRMALGGMYDHVGGGFARYSVDERWLVPHFEKMLYNQALLVPSYLDGWRLTGSPLYRRVVEQTLDFVRRELTDPGGGCYSSLDADSEGQEGKFYVWTRAEVDAELGAADARLFSDIYGVTAEGNFDGHNIPNLLAGSLAERAAASGEDEARLVERIEPLRLRLLEARGRRPRPLTDDKILTAWNGLMIGAFARAYQLFGRDEDLASATGAAEFVLSELTRDGRLLVSYREGQAQLNAYLDDHAFLARGLVDLYEATFDVRRLEQAERVVETMLERFRDRDDGGFFFTSDDHESLLTRNRSLHDGALPSGTGVAVEVLLRLAVHLDRDDLRSAAKRALASLQRLVARMPSAYTSLLLAAELSWTCPVEIALIGAANHPLTRELLATARRHTRRVVIQHTATPTEDRRLALLRDKTTLEDGPTVYVCRNYACRQPTRDPAELARQLDDA